MIRFLIATALILCSITATRSVQAAPVLADISNYHIMMDSSFNGTRLFVFGARNDSGDVVVVIRGPLRKYIVRKKEEIAGIWVNRDRIKLFNMPDYYAIASSKPLESITNQTLLNHLAIGHNFLFAPPANPDLQARHQEFTEAFIAHQQKRRLYFAEPFALSFMGETLFKAAIDFPDTIPPGSYNAEIYLINDQQIVGSHVLPIRVGKVGLDAFLYDYAHYNPFLYGITAVVMALSAGWFAGRLFEKF